MVLLGMIALVELLDLVAALDGGLELGGRAAGGDSGGHLLSVGSRVPWRDSRILVKWQMALVLAPASMVATHQQKSHFDAR